MKYPIGIQDFEKVIKGGYVYQDKTELIYDMVNNGSIYFLSRPRRFGKSLLFLHSNVISVVRRIYSKDLPSKILRPNGCPYTMRCKDSERECERYFHYTFYLIFRIISTYLVLTEKQQSEGRADCIIETNNDIFIFEFKLDGTADETLAQIDTRGYARQYADDTRRIHIIGASFSSTTGTIDDWKVK